MSLAYQNSSGAVDSSEYSRAGILRRGRVPHLPTSSGNESFAGLMTRRKNLVDQHASRLTCGSRRANCGGAPQNPRFHDDLDPLRVGKLPVAVQRVSNWLLALNDFEP